MKKLESGGHLTVYPLSSLRGNRFDIVDLYALNGQTIEELIADISKQYLGRKTVQGYEWQAYLLDILNECVDHGLDADQTEDVLTSVVVLMQEIEHAAYVYRHKGDVVKIDFADTRRLYLYCQPFQKST